MPGLLGAVTGPGIRNCTDMISASSASQTFSAAPACCATWPEPSSACVKSTQSDSVLTSPPPGASADPKASAPPSSAGAATIFGPSKSGATNAAVCYEDNDTGDDIFWCKPLTRSGTSLSA